MPLPIIKNKNVEIRPHVSFSEILVYFRCCFQHHLKYIQKIPQEDTIFTVYGKAVGEALERYRKYEKRTSWILMSKKIFRFILDNGFGEYVSEKDQDWRFWVKSAFRVFEDTIDFLDQKYPGYELIDFEYPLYEDVEGTNKKFKGYIDIIIKHNDKIYIIDFKTTSSFFMWKKKADTHKLYQVVLYKYFYCQKTGTDPNDVETAYLLLNRKPSKKDKSSVELVETTSGIKKMNNAVEWMKEQINGIDAGIKIAKVDTCEFCICGAKKK